MTFMLLVICNQTTYRRTVQYIHRRQKIRGVNSVHRIILKFLFYIFHFILYVPRAPKTGSNPAMGDLILYGLFCNDINQILIRHFTVGWLMYL